MTSGVYDSCTYQQSPHDWLQQAKLDQYPVLSFYLFPMFYAHAFIDMWKSTLQRKERAGGTVRRKAEKNRKVARGRRRRQRFDVARNKDKKWSKSTTTWGQHGRTTCLRRWQDRKWQTNERMESQEQEKQIKEQESKEQEKMETTRQIVLWIMLSSLPVVALNSFRVFVPLFVPEMQPSVCQGNIGKTCLSDSPSKEPCCWFHPWFGGGPPPGGPGPYMVLACIGMYHPGLCKSWHIDTRCTSYFITLVRWFTAKEMDHEQAFRHFARRSTLVPLSLLNLTGLWAQCLWLYSLTHVDDFSWGGKLQVSPWKRLCFQCPFWASGLSPLKHMHECIRVGLHYSVGLHATGTWKWCPLSADQPTEECSEGKLTDPSHLLCTLDLRLLKLLLHWCLAFGLTLAWALHELGSDRLDFWQRRDEICGEG